MARRVHVASPGPRTTVEDLGRRMVARHGVPAGGAFDALSLVAANRLVGNDDADAGLEATLGGPTLDNAGDEPVHVALVGADCAATIASAGGSRPAALGRAHCLAPGEVLRMGFARDGARVWIALAGGVDVPPVLGSRSTSLAASFGGLEGRALRRGDLLRLGAPRRAPLGTSWHEPGPAAPVTLRVLPGPQLDRFAGGALDALCATRWAVRNESDRTGVRLAPAEDGDVSPLRGAAGIAPEGTTLGAMQVPPDGCPILLGPDRPVTGGYAKPAVLAAADVGRLARLRPGDGVRFVVVSLDEACALLRARRAPLEALGA
ncbi:MAG: biotin-dependent carboxyltransferase family protein [Thermodesulfobacteriota bacterium]